MHDHNFIVMDLNKIKNLPSILRIKLKRIVKNIIRILKFNKNTCLYSIGEESNIYTSGHGLYCPWYFVPQPRIISMSSAAPLTLKFSSAAVQNTADNKHVRNVLGV